MKYYVAYEVIRDNNKEAIDMKILCVTTKRAEAEKSERLASNCFNFGIKEYKAENK